MSGLFTVTVLYIDKVYSANIRISVEANLIARNYQDSLVELRRFDDYESAKQFAKLVNEGNYV